MSRLIQLFPLYGIFLLLGCAAQGPPSGGRIDEKGPSLISIAPDNVLKIAPDQTITFFFDELIDPVSIPPSVQIGSNLKYKLKISLIIYWNLPIV